MYLGGGGGGMKKLVLEGVLEGVLIVNRVMMRRAIVFTWEGEGVV